MMTELVCIQELMILNSSRDAMSLNEVPEVKNGVIQYPIKWFTVVAALELHIKNCKRSIFRIKDILENFLPNEKPDIFKPAYFQPL